MPIPALVKPGQ